MFSRSSEPRPTGTVNARADGHAASEWADEAGAGLKDLFDNAPYAIFQMDLEGRLLLSNPAALQFLGFASLDDAKTGLGSVENLFVDPTRWSELTRRLHAERRVYWFEAEVILPRSGERLWVTISAWVKTCSGVPYAFEGMVQNVSGSVRGRRKLARSEAHLAQARRLASIGSWELDLRTRDIEWSPDTYRIYGLDPAAFQPDMERVLDLFHDEDRQRVAEHIDEVVNDGGGLSITARFVHASGDVRWGEYIADRLVSEDGVLIGLVGTIQDITDRKTAEEALFRSEERFRLALQAGQLGVWEWDVASNALTWSPELRDLYGFGPDTPVTYETWYESLHPEDRDRVVAEVAGHLDPRSSGEVVLEHRIVRPDGTLRWLSCHGRMTYRNVKGELRPHRLVGVARDFTSNHEAEAALRRSEDHLARAQHIAAIGSWELDLRTREASWSAEAYRILGHDPKTYVLTLESALAIYHEEDRPQALQHMVRAEQGESGEFECRVVHPGGEVRWVQVEYDAVRERDRLERLVGTVRDITDRKKSDQALARALAVNEVTNAALRRIAFGAGVQDSLDVIVKGIESLQAGLIGSIMITDVHGTGLMTAAAPSLPADYLAAIDGVRIAPDAGSCGAAAFRRERVVVENIATHPNWAAFRGAAHAAGLRACWSEPILDAGDQVLGTFSLYYREPRGPDADMLAALELGRSLACLALERHRQDEHLRQAQKMEAIGQLTGGIAHDFNNLLAVTIGNLDLLESEIGKIDLLEEARRAALRGADLIARLLAFSRRQELRPQKVDVRAVIKEHLKLLARLLRDDIILSLRLPDGLWPVYVDAHQLEAALTNLVTNARDAMPGGGTLTISGRNVQLTTAESRPQLAPGAYVVRNAQLAAAESGPQLAPGAYVVLDVHDTGIGMSPAVLERVLEPFFTTKEVGKGTGLGLPMVYGFAKQSGGHFTLSSVPGQGTTATLYLPRVEAALETKAPETVERAPAEPGEVVLLVDDNNALRMLMARQLRQLGYTIVEAGSGPEALALEAGLDRLDLLLTDILMPGGMDGIALARQVHDRRPDAAVLLMSGFTENDLGKDADTANFAVLPKPLRIQEIARRIRRELAGRRKN